MPQLNHIVSYDLIRVYLTVADEYYQNCQLCTMSPSMDNRSKWNVGC